MINKRLIEALILVVLNVTGILIFVEAAGNNSTRTFHGEVAIPTSAMDTEVTTAIIVVVVSGVTTMLIATVLHYRYRHDRVIDVLYRKGTGSGVLDARVGEEQDTIKPS